MMIENKKENGVKIYCIYFKNTYENDNLDASSILEDIVTKGGTDIVYTSDSLESLCKVFDRINEAIETNYRLKLNK